MTTNKRRSQTAVSHMMGNTKCTASDTDTPPAHWKAQSQSHSLVGSVPVLVRFPARMKLSFTTPSSVSTLNKCFTQTITLSLGHGGVSSKTPNDAPLEMASLRLSRPTAYPGIGRCTKEKGPPKPASFAAKQYQ